MSEAAVLHGDVPQRRSAIPSRWPCRPTAALLGCAVCFWIKPAVGKSLFTRWSLMQAMASPRSCEPWMSANCRMSALSLPILAFACSRKWSKPIPIPSLLSIREEGEQAGIPRTRDQRLVTMRMPSPTPCGKKRGRPWNGVKEAEVPCASNSSPSAFMQGPVVLAIARLMDAVGLGQKAGCLESVPCQGRKASRSGF